MSIGPLVEGTGRCMLCNTEVLDVEEHLAEFHPVPSTPAASDLSWDQLVDQAVNKLIEIVDTELSPKEQVQMVDEVILDLHALRVQLNRRKT